jgi:hypothetical protein
MHRLPKPTRMFYVLSLFCFSLQTLAASQAAPAQTESAQPIAAALSSSAAEHVYGLPGVKAKEKGSLKITAGGLSFTGKTGASTIPLQSMIAAGSDNERVELWGMKGRLLRMAIPNGGGLLAATIMHHRVDMFTVEFSDQNGGYHGAVFILPARDVERALLTISSMAPAPHRGPPSNACAGGPVNPGTVRVPLPAWNYADVPAAYRALVYEHLIERLQQSKGIEHVYRDGEAEAQGGCPQFTVQLSITGFKPGNQVVRASTGPVGMFVNTTRMVVEVRITTAEGDLDVHDQITATVRGESENTNVAESVARKVVKEFVVSQKRSSAGYPAATAVAASSR